MTSHMPTRRSVMTAALASVALTACSSAKKSDSNASSGEDVTKRLKAAQDKIGKTSGYHTKVTCSAAPKDEPALKAGEGDVVNSPAAFKGDVTASTQGNEIRAGIISIGDKNWVKPSFSPKYLTVNLKSLGVPSPTSLFNATSGIPAMPLMSKDMKRSGEKLVGGEKVTTYKGTLDGPSAAKAMGFGKTRGDYTVEVGLTDSDELRTMIITGPFFDSADATYTIDISKYDQKVDIKQP